MQPVIPRSHSDTGCNKPSLIKECSDQLLNRDQGAIPTDLTKLFLFLAFYSCNISCIFSFQNIFKTALLI